MRRFVGLAFLGLIGCASGVTREEFDEVKKKLASIEQVQEAQNAKQARLYEDLLDKHNKIQERLTHMDSVVKILETTSKRIEDRLRKGVSPGNGGGGEEVKPADVATRTTEALLGLRTGKVSVEDVVANLRPIAKDAAPLLVEELKRAATDTKYANQLVAILSNLPSAAIRIPIVAALQDRGLLRTFAARIIGNLKDRETSKALESHATTDDEDFRLVVGEALVSCRNPAGLPLLVQSLRSKEYANRVISIEVLRRLNQGEDFAYRANRPNENDDAIRKWEEWAKTLGKTIFD